MILATVLKSGADNIIPGLLIEEVRLQIRLVLEEKSRLCLLEIQCSLHNTPLSPGKNLRIF